MRFSLRRRRRALWLVPVTAAALAGVLIWRLQSVFMTAVACYANTVITDRVNRAVYDAFCEGDEFEQIDKDSGGRVVSLAADMAKINRLKAKTVVRVQEELAKDENASVRVPLSAALGVPMLGYGIMVPVRVAPMSTVDDDIEEVFERSGINQTLYKLNISIRAGMTYSCAGFSRTEAITTTVPVISTVINADVPSYYGVLSGTDASVE